MRNVEFPLAPLVVHVSDFAEHRTLHPRAIVHAGDGPGTADVPRVRVRVRVKVRVRVRVRVRVKVRVRVRTRCGTAHMLWWRRCTPG